MKIFKCDICEDEMTADVLTVITVPAMYEVCVECLKKIQAYIKELAAFNEMVRKAKSR